jgi:plasmid maintenance system killer protein
MQQRYAILFKNKRIQKKKFEMHFSMSQVYTGGKRTVKITTKMVAHVCVQLHIFAASIKHVILQQKKKKKHHNDFFLLERNQYSRKELYICGVMLAVHW